MTRNGTKLGTSRLAEDMVSDGIRSERGPFGFGNVPVSLATFLKYLHSAILLVGRTEVYGSRGVDKANSRNMRPANYKPFTVHISCTYTVYMSKWKY